MNTAVIYAINEKQQIGGRIMNFPDIKKFLTNNHRFISDHPEYRRVYLINVIILYYIAVAVIFAVLNATTASYTQTAITAVAGLLCVALLIYLHKTDRIDISSYALVILMCATIIAIFSSSGNTHYMLIWISVFPPMTFFLLGRRKAIIASAFILTYLLVFMLLNYRNWVPDQFGTASFVNILSSTVVLIILIGYFETTRSEAVKIAQDKNLELEASNRALTENKEKLRLILDSTAEAIFGIDLECRCTFCNTSCLELLGLKSEEELLGKDVHELLHSRHRDGSPLHRHECSIIRTCMEGDASHSDDEVFWRTNGTSFDVEYNSYPQYKDGALIGAVVTFTDNTIKRMHEQQIEYYSSHDSLTGLYNRNHFEYLLSKVDTNSNLPISIIECDLNGLKLTNDVFGHAAGDELLVMASEAIKKVCREGDIIARLGGDEFVILLPKTINHDAQQIISRIRDVLSREKAGVIRCSMSLGCDTKTSASQKIDMTVKNAENEMYKEKALNSEICRSIAEALELPQTEIKLLRNAGFLHDIGKVSISESILRKCGEFTAQEDIEYRQHPVIGYRLLNLFDDTVNLAESVYCHHEHWDGSGYPRGLSGEEIPLMARIIAVAGRYEAILNCGAGLGRHEEVLEQLRADAGVRLDPALVDIFIKIMEEDRSGK
jgi:diguanylate cyclase (GGDEF)-like protein/PAS domain S-box-containing protein